MLNRVEEDNLFWTIFSDEAALHLSGKMTGHNLITWMSQNSHQVFEHMRGCTKVNVVCGVLRFTNHSCFATYWSSSLSAHWCIVIWQQDEASTDYHRDVTLYLTRYSGEDGSVVAASFRGEPHHSIWYPWIFPSGDSWKIMCTIHPFQWTFNGFVTGLLKPQIW